MLLTYLTGKNLDETRADIFISYPNFVIHESETFPSILAGDRSKHRVSTENVWVQWQLS